MEWNKINEEIKIWNWITLLSLSLLSYILFSPAHTFGTIVGGFLVITNFNILQHTLCKAFGNRNILKSKRISIIFKFYFRIIVLGFVIAVLVLKGWIDPLGLATGLSTVVFAITLFGIRIAIKPKGREVF
ncbi:MAG: ATP synthase subunit I [Desulfobacteraceae bacterium]|jgi:hypothetical protein